MIWPDWWSWELELTPHLRKRMLDRSFSEIELRLMLEIATRFHDNHEEGRYLIETTHGGRCWSVIVEPSATDQTLIVVTAYPID